MPEPQSLDNKNSYQHVLPRWHFREILRSKSNNEKSETDLILSYSELSIGSVLAIVVKPNFPQESTLFYSVKLAPLIATYIQHILIWQLTLRGNRNLGESGMYNNLTDEERINDVWSPHYSFLVNGESTAIETKIQIRKILINGSDSLRSQSREFLHPLPNDPTRKQYIPHEKRGKRSKFDPGPVFGTSLDFLESEAKLQKFFNE